MAVEEAQEAINADDQAENGGLRWDCLLATSAPMTAEEFKALRKSLGLSQTDMARILGVVVLTVKRAEKRGPTRELEALLEVALAKGQLRIKRPGDRPGSPPDQS